MGSVERDRSRARRVNRRSLTPSERVSRSRRRALEGGARRVEVIIRDPAVVKALDRGIRLQGSAITAISEALRIAYLVDR